MKIKIAYIIDSLVTSGAGTEKQLLLLLNGLDRDRFAPHLFCLRDSEWLKSQSFDFPVEIIDVGSLLRPGVLLKARRLGCRLCQRPAQT